MYIRFGDSREDVTVRMNKNVLSWFGHVERMSDERIAKKIYDGKIDLWKHSIKDTGGRSRKKHEDLPESMYKEIHDDGRGERGM